MTQHDRIDWLAGLFDANVPEAFGATRASQRLHKTIKEAQDEVKSWMGNNSISWQLGLGRISGSRNGPRCRSL